MPLSKSRNPRRELEAALLGFKKWRRWQVGARRGRAESLPLRWSKSWRLLGFSFFQFRRWSTLPCLRCEAARSRTYLPTPRQTKRGLLKAAIRKTSRDVIGSPYLGPHNSGDPGPSWLEFRPSTSSWQAQRAQRCAESLEMSATSRGVCALFVVRKLLGQYTRDFYRDCRPPFNTLFGAIGHVFGQSLPGAPTSLSKQNNSDVATGIGRTSLRGRKSASARVPAGLVGSSFKPA